jgi:hypothetical protein
MRPAARFMLAIALSFVPRPAWTQVPVTAPAPGAAASYRTTVISWDAIPGASSYHLEIDDDPNFGSPEVDVTVAGTSYALSGQRLNLNGRLSWAAYVRLNGVRWNANTFTPVYINGGGSPALAADSQSRVYVAFEGIMYGNGVHLTTSSNWSNLRRLSHEDVFTANGLDLAVDENDVAHAFWHEGRAAGGWAYYANSATGWNRVTIMSPVDRTCAEYSMVVKGGPIELFEAVCDERIDRFTSMDGVQFTRTTLPNSDIATSVSAARDGVGNLYVATERFATRFDDLHSTLQTSADGWIPHRMGPGRFPSIAVTPTGEVHALRWTSDEEYQQGGSSGFRYSNSLRGFATWTALPAPNSLGFNQDVLPLIVNESAGQLHAALPGANGVQLCSAASTGQAADTGTAWTCASIGTDQARNPDLALAPDGTVHVAWDSGFDVGYANSLGSFLATNFAPHVSLGSPSSTATAVIVPGAISDADRDDLSGDVQIGRYEFVTSLIGPGTGAEIFDGRYGLVNDGNSSLGDPAGRLQFRHVGSPEWGSLYRDRLPGFPVIVEVRQNSAQATWLGVLRIDGWDDTGASVAEVKFSPHVAVRYQGALPDAVDISSLSDGDWLLAVAAWDGTTQVYDVRLFSKSSGQNQLLLTAPAAAHDHPTLRFNAASHYTAGARRVVRTHHARVGKRSLS